MYVGPTCCEEGCSISSSMCKTIDEVHASASAHVLYSEGADLGTSIRVLRINVLKFEI
jgi:hypothetical protein